MTTLTDALKECRKALMALYLEVPKAVADDVRARVETALAAAREDGRREAMQWRDIESAPKDGTRILVFGHWDYRAAEHCQGQPHICAASWSTWMSDGSGYHWIYEGGLGQMAADNIAVTFTHWLPLPPSPETKHDE